MVQARASGSAPTKATLPVREGSDYEDGDQRAEPERLSKKAKHCWAMIGHAYVALARACPYAASSARRLGLSSSDASLDAQAARSASATISPASAITNGISPESLRSEERRVGKECTC